MTIRSFTGRRNLLKIMFSPVIKQRRCVLHVHGLLLSKSIRDQINIVPRVQLFFFFRFRRFLFGLVADSVPVPGSPSSPDSSRSEAEGGGPERFRIGPLSSGLPSRRHRARRARAGSVRSSRRRATTAVSGLGVSKKEDKITQGR